MDIEQKIEKIEERFEFIEKEIGLAPKKVWYKQLSNLVSIAAVLIAFATLLLQYLNENKREFNSSLTEFQDVIYKLKASNSRLRFLNNRKVFNDDERLLVSSEIEAIGEQTIIDLKRLDGSFGRVKNHISPFEVITLAETLVAGGRFDNVVKYFEFAIQRASDESVKVRGMSGLAAFLYLESSYSNIEKGRKLFEDSMALYDNEVTVNAKMRKAEILIMWLQALININDLDSAQLKLNDVKSVIASFPDNMQNLNKNMLFHLSRISKSAGLEYD